MASEQLKPCPFCGAAAETDLSMERFEYCTGGPNSVMEYGHIVYCTRCSASIGNINVPPADEEEAIAEWNCRATSGPAAQPVMPAEVREAMHLVANVYEYMDDHYATLLEGKRVLDAARLVGRWLEQPAAPAEVLSLLSRAAPHIMSHIEFMEDEKNPYLDSDSSDIIWQQQIDECQVWLNEAEKWLEQQEMNR